MLHRQQRLSQSPIQESADAMKILLPVDGSSHSLSSARYVAERLLAADPDAELELVHVRFRIPPRPAAAVGRALLEEYYRSEMAEAVKGVREYLDRRHVPYKLLRMVGHPSAEIAQHAAAADIDLVVMGAHGLGAAKGLLLGSVTQGVIAGCTVPLLVVRDEQMPPPKGEVLVAVDGSAHTRKAIVYLLRHRDLLAPAARITLMHVSPISQMPRFTFATGKAALRQQREREREQAMRGARRLLAKAKGIKCREVHVTGDPGERIADYARGNHCSLIVMGSHGHGLMSSLLLGSVAQKTLAAARTPVLIIR